MREAAAPAAQPAPAMEDEHEALVRACSQSLAVVMPRLGRVLKSRMRDGARTMQQMIILGEIQDGARPGELSRRCSLSGPATTAALDGMVEDGLCGRTHSEKDRRTVLVRLTPKGQQVLAESRASAADTMREMLRGHNDEQRAELLAVLRELDLAASSYLARMPS